MQAILRSPGRLDDLANDCPTGVPVDQVLLEGLAEIAALACQAAGAVITLFGEPRSVGAFSMVLCPRPAVGAQLPLVDPLWKLVAASADVVEIPDTHRDRRAGGNLSMEVRGIRSYLGAPLRTEDGRNLGVLSVVDTQPGRWGERHRRVVANLADAITLELRSTSGGSRPERAPDENPRGPARPGGGTVPQQRSPELAVRLREAIEAGQVEVHYQPVIDLTTGAVHGVEALARWTDLSLGPISPATFVPLAEQSGLIADLGMHVLRVVIADLADHGPSAMPRAAVNLSPLHLADRNLAHAIRQILRHSGVDPDRLTIEVTEAMVGDQQMIDSLRQLRDIGVSVAIDDFGTGFSSLARLRDLPVNVLKIDKSFLIGLSDPRQLGVLRGVVGIATALDLRIVAEGIETPEQAVTVQEFGMGLAQGWLFAQAMCVAEYAAWHHSWEAKRTWVQ